MTKISCLRFANCYLVVSKYRPVYNIVIETVCKGKCLYGGSQNLTLKLILTFLDVSYTKAVTYEHAFAQIAFMEGPSEFSRHPNI